MSASSVPRTQCTNAHCQHKLKPIQMHYKCQVCQQYLHPSTLGCSQPADDDGIIECLPEQGCNSWARLPALSAAQKPDLHQETLAFSVNGCISVTLLIDESDAKPAAKAANLLLKPAQLHIGLPALLGLLQNSSRLNSGSTMIPLQQLPQNQGKMAASSHVPAKLITIRASQSSTKMKRGPKPNGKWVELDNSVWYNACEIYMTKYSHMNYSTFLKGTESRPHFTGKKANVFLLAKN